jgi:hypothetical protein
VATRGHPLAEVEGAYRKAAAQTEQLRKRRNTLIREAVAGGMRKAEVARLTGLGRGRIGQIVNDNREE